ncbi:hypothetical protein [Streptomyces sp. NPDC001978]
MAKRGGNTWGRRTSLARSADDEPDTTAIMAMAMAMGAHAELLE